MKLKLTPKEIVDYIFENGYEADILSNMQLHKGNFSIAEIADKEFAVEAGKCQFRSKMYSVNTEIEDEEIFTAVHNGLYVSAFISRRDEVYQVHFLVHQYPVSMKARFEDEITREVIRYLVMSTVLVLKLDSKKKVKEYIGIR